MINDTHLVRLMKKAHKGGGLRVWRLDYDYALVHGPGDDMDSLFMTSGFWATLMPMEQVPGKVLGTLAEWLHRLPYCGEALHLMKGMEPEQLVDEGTRGETILNTAPPNADASHDCKATRFYIGDSRVFQRRDLSFVLVNMELLALLDNRVNMGRMATDETAVYWGDPDSLEHVWCTLHRNVPEKDLERLQQQNFWEDSNE